MKKSLADRIEQYIKVLIARSEERQIEIQRAELAETFACVPSQVSYVLATRFTEREGYLTESRRGGGGFVRITECTEEYLELLMQDSYLTEFIRQLAGQGILTPREAELIHYIIIRAGKDLPVEYRFKLHEAAMSALRDYFEG